MASAAILEGINKIFRGGGEGMLPDPDPPTFAQATALISEPAPGLLQRRSSRYLNRGLCCRLDRFYPTCIVPIPGREQRDTAV